MAFMWRPPLKREEGKPVADRYRPCPCGGRRSRESRKFFLGPAWLRRASFTSMASSESESDSLHSPCRAMLEGPRKTLERALGTLAVAITLSRPSSSFSPTSASLAGGANKNRASWRDTLRSNAPRPSSMQHTWRKARLSSCV